MPLDEETLKAIKDTVDASLKEGLGAAVNTAVTARLKREIGGDEFKATLGEVVKTAVASTVPPKKDPKKDNPGDSELARELADIKKGFAEERAAREAAETRAKKSEERSALVDRLTAGGVKDMLEPAIALLMTAENRVARDDTGAIMWRGDDKLTPFEPMEKGVAAWLETDLGKRFLPPKPIAGSGSREPGEIGQRGSDGKVTYNDGDLGDLMSSI